MKKTNIKDRINLSIKRLKSRSREKVRRAIPPNIRDTLKVIRDLWDRSSDDCLIESDEEDGHTQTQKNECKLDAVRVVDALRVDVFGCDTVELIAAGFRVERGARVCLFQGADWGDCGLHLGGGGGGDRRSCFCIFLCGG